MLHQVIETLNSRVALRSRYDNFIGGDWVAPTDGRYFDNVSPLTGKPVCQIARSQAADIELALDAAHKAKDAWGNTVSGPARRDPQQDRRPHGGESRADRRGRDHRQRQADPRDPRRRHPARHRSFPLFRGLRAGAGRHARRARPRHRRLSLPRAARRGRARSSRGTSRSSWPAGSWRPLLPPATAWC